MMIMMMMMMMVMMMDTIHERDGQTDGHRSMTNKERKKETNKQTNGDENKTSLAEIITIKTTTMLTTEKEEHRSKDRLTWKQRNASEQRSSSS